MYTNVGFLPFVWLYLWFLFCVVRCVDISSTILTLNSWCWCVMCACHHKISESREIRKENHQPTALIKKLLQWKATQLLAQNVIYITSVSKFYLLNRNGLAGILGFYFPFNATKLNESVNRNSTPNIAIIILVFVLERKENITKRPHKLWDLL